MISNLFSAISSAEGIHVKNHLKALEKIRNSKVIIEDIVHIDTQQLQNNVKSTRENLLQAIAGETYEFKKMYKTFIKNARYNNLYLAEYSFNLARKAEKVHSKLFKKFLKNLDNGNHTEKQDLYVCQICGNVELGEPPRICPVCEHDQKFFKKFSQ